MVGGRIVLVPVLALLPFPNPRTRTRTKDEEEFSGLSSVTGPPSSASARIPKGQ